MRWDTAVSVADLQQYFYRYAGLDNSNRKTSDLCRERGRVSEPAVRICPSQKAKSSFL